MQDLQKTLEDLLQRHLGMKEIETLLKLLQFILDSVPQSLQFPIP